MDFPMLQFDCSKDVTPMEEQFFIVKPKEEIIRSFKLYPATDKAAKYVCAAIFKDADYNEVDRAECQFTTTSTVLDNGTQSTSFHSPKKGMSGFFQTIESIWNEVWKGLTDFIAGKTCRRKCYGFFDFKCHNPTYMHELDSDVWPIFGNLSDRRNCLILFMIGGRIIVGLITTVFGIFIGTELISTTTHANKHNQRHGMRHHHKSGDHHTRKSIHNDRRHDHFEREADHDYHLHHVHKAKHKHRRLGNTRVDVMHHLVDNVGPAQLEKEERNRRRLF